MLDSDFCFFINKEKILVIPRFLPTTILPDVIVGGKWFRGEGWPRSTSPLMRRIQLT